MRACSIAVLSVLSHAAVAAPCAQLSGNPVMMAIDPQKLSYCFEISDEKLVCLITELSTGTTVPTLPPPDDKPRALLASEAPKVKLENADRGKKPQLCRADGTRCKTLAMTHEIDPATGVVTAHNAALTIAALGTPGWIDTFDLRTGKRLASFPTGATKRSCNTLEFAGDTLVIGEPADCAAPARTAWLATTTGKKLADVGGDTPLTLGSMTPVSGSTYAFATRTGDAIVLQDVTTGKVTRRISVGGGDAYAPAFIVGNGTTLALVHGGMRAGDVAVIDLATDKVSRYPGKRCPRPPTTPP